MASRKPRVPPSRYKALSKSKQPLAITSGQQAPVTFPNFAGNPWPFIAGHYKINFNGTNLPKHLDLVKLTSLVFPEGSRKLDIILKNKEMEKIPMSIKRGRKRRGTIGTTCERPGCSWIELMDQKREDDEDEDEDCPDGYDSKGKGKSKEPATTSVAKRCGRCKQVIYCGRQCQVADWPRHKPVCRAGAHIQKDGIIRLIRRFIANPCTMVLVKSYCRDALNLDADPKAGTRSCVNFVCTTVPETWAKTSHRSGQDDAPPLRRVLQVSRVEIVPSVATPHAQVSGGVGEEQSSAAPSYGLGDMAPEDFDDYTLLLTFRTDTPGINCTVLTIESVLPAMMKIMVKNPQPVVSLLHLNQTIREDVDDAFGLRMDGP